jgi:BT1 family
MSFFGTFRLAYLPVLITYFAYGASSITGIALLYFQKEMLKLEPTQVAQIGFWLGLPWSMKMVVGVASDRYPILGHRRRPYLILGALASVVGYGMLATIVDSPSSYLVAMLLVTTGFMVQDVVADALSVELAATDTEVGQIQTFGRVATLAGGISVGYVSGVLAGAIGARAVCGLAMALPLMVMIAACFVRPVRRIEVAPGEGSLAHGNAHLIMLVGLSYAALGVGLEMSGAPGAQEIILVVSGGLIGLLLYRMNVSRAVVIAAGVIFLFRSTPNVGQGYSYWAIDGLGFDQEFLGILSQVSSVLSLIGLLVFRKSITQRPVSFTLFWVMIAGAVLFLPNIGLFYGIHTWLGVSPRTFAFVDTTISAPLNQLTMVPMLVLIARTAPKGAEATTFAIMASLMNLALSASELFTRYANEYFAVTQQDYSNLGRLMITVMLVGLLPLLTLPLLRRTEDDLAREHAAPAKVDPATATTV